MSDAKTGQNRRDFLKLAGTAPAAAAAVAVTGEQAAASELAEGEGLRQTEHTKKFLETARF